ncbi:NADPH-dependent FMN reductase [Planobispora longispora]|uniref:Reductase n=1 Tax=Planobispora longispora TaxID=28887 RepID=A0A8J3RH32_9ACTN|nr:NAD(P)H-dependent oxidoreductase [Planobispora longispora]BFE87243.1 NAD(P)H-dependent oxidoreductase [Planobispora longispora]GIH74843.1 reductase [Planobispora longispora]
MPLLKVIVASTRPGRIGRNIGDWFTGHAAGHGGFDVELADLAEIGLPFLDEPEHPSKREYVHQHTKDWSAAIDPADAFVFVMPEYNYGFNAPLKNAIDFLYHEWRYKPVGFVSYGGMSGGLRAVQMIKQVVTTLRMVPAGEAVTVFTRQSVDPDGRLVPDAGLTAAATGMLDELGRLAEAMSAMRARA